MDLMHQLEAVLFYKSEPVDINLLAQILTVDEDHVRKAADDLREALVGRGVRLLEAGGKYTLITAPEASDLIQQLAKEELSRDIGKAGLETLTIILYRQEISRAEIDYIRGVNSNFILRHLLVRGLIERRPNPADARSYVYRPTAALIAHLGLTKADELPDFSKIQNEINDFMLKKENLDLDQIIEK